MNNARPIHLDLRQISLPLPGLVSIMHRVSGTVLFLALPLLLWWLQQSLTSLNTFTSVQAYRFLADTRDEATNERLDNLEDPYRLFRCHSIMNCVDVCPKGLNPTQAIGKIKKLLVKRMV
jgi:hypothetical protein